MYWVLAGLAICAAIVIAGRAHSRQLNKLDENVWISMMSPPPDFAVFCRDCGSLSVLSDYSDGALSSRIDNIRCGVCKSYVARLVPLKV